MKILNLTIVAISFMSCDSEDGGSAAQQPCYYALSNYCISEDSVEIDGNTDKIVAIARFSTIYTGQSVRGDCQTPAVESLPTDEVKLFDCGGETNISNELGESECKIKGGYFKLLHQNLEMSAFVGDS